MNLVVHSQTLPPTASQSRTSVRVLDYSCPGGYPGLEWRLRRVPGVGRVALTSRGDAVRVTFDPSRTNLAELEFVVAAEGYRIQ
jgi:uncharacterized protein (AIM24 family)